MIHRLMTTVNSACAFLISIGSKRKLILFCLSSRLCMHGFKGETCSGLESIGNGRIEKAQSQTSIHTLNCYVNVSRVCTLTSRSSTGNFLYGRHLSNSLVSSKAVIGNFTRDIKFAWGFVCVFSSILMDGICFANTAPSLSRPFLTA